MPEERIVFTLDSSLQELETLSERLTDAGRKWRLPQMMVLQLNLALDELFTNVISYGFDGGPGKPIVLTLDYEPEQVTVTMVDGGCAFDPTRPADPDLSLAVEDKDIGGLGIFLARQYVDDLKYCREKNKNVVTLIKKNPQQNMQQSSS